MQPSAQILLDRAQVIIAVSFGTKTGKTLKSNKDLAYVCDCLSWRSRIPVMAQIEIAFLLSEPACRTISRHRFNVDYLDTHEVILQCSQTALAHGLERAIIVAHPDHQWRAMHVAKKLGFTVYAADVSKVHYDAQSSQWWTRGRWRFMAREVLARLMYLRQGKI